MINLPSDQELEELESFSELHCLSIYAPFVEPNTSENPTRIEVKNLLREAEKALESAGVPERDIRKTLRPIKEKMEQDEIRPSRGEGLAFFAHSSLFRCYHIPNHTTPYQFTVGTGFNLEPMQESTETNKQYFVLTLGHRNVRFYEGDRDRISQVELKNFPDDMLKALRIDELPKSLQPHRVAPVSLGKGSERFHEQYNDSQVDKSMLKNFFRRIDKYLHSHLTKHGRPLILGGVDYELVIYRSINTYPHLADGVISGNLENAGLDDIRQRAWAIASGQ